MPRPRSNVPSGIRALERGIQVLFFLSDHGDELSIAQISAGLKLGGATVYRMLITLEGLGLVAQNPDNSKYRLTTRIVDMSRRLLDSLDIRAQARPEMTRLRDLTRETVSLYIRVGDQRSCIEQVESTQDVRRASALGRSFPLLSGSSGKVLAAWLPEPERDAVVDDAEGTDIDGRVARRDDLESDLASVARDGYSVAEEQGALGLTGISFPIFDAAGVVIAALSVSGPAGRWDSERIRLHRDAIGDAAARISAALGYRIPQPIPA